VPRSASDKSVTTPNATTLYGLGYYDLSHEPVAVITPSVPDRYFSVQASDQYPRWFFQIGNQFTGREAQQCLIVGPGFTGPYPGDFAAKQVYQSQSNCGLLVVRYALKSTESDEIAAVNALMDKNPITPLSVWEKNNRKPVRAEDQPIVEPDYATFPRMKDLVEIATNLTISDLLQLVSLVLNDPIMTLRTDSAKEIATLGRISKLGLAPGVAFDPDWLSAEQWRIAEAAFTEAKQESAGHVQQSFTNRNGWSMITGLLQDINDYVQQGYYGLTTIGAPIPARSHTGAFGFVDTDGNPLNGASRYTLTFDLGDLPPVTEFWELPLYDENGYFHDNEIDRYSLNSFMLERGDLHTEAGKLIVYIQHGKPQDPNQIKNWLPAPEANFHFALRFYGPKCALVDGSYNIPGIVRVS
jgi:hypothetical protein